MRSIEGEIKVVAINLLGMYGPIVGLIGGRWESKIETQMSLMSIPNFILGKHFYMILGFRESKELLLFLDHLAIE